MKNFKLISVTATLLMITPVSVGAVIQNLNSQTGQTQTFSNDSNIAITSSSNVHTLGWSGLLPLSRGGTGANSFLSGSILFSNGTSVTQDNQNLFWDDSNNRLGIGITQPTATLEVRGTGPAPISIFNSTYTDGGFIRFDQNGQPYGYIGSAKRVAPVGGGGSTDLGISANGRLFIQGKVLMAVRDGTSSSGERVGIGTVEPLTMFHAAIPDGTNDTYVGIFEHGQTDGDVGGLFVSTVRNSNNYILAAAQGSFLSPNYRFVVQGNGNVGIGTSGPNEKLDVAGNIKADSTIFLGSSIKPGCIVMGDSDGAGLTYIIVNDGVITATTTQPSICQ